MLFLPVVDTVDTILPGAQAVDTISVIMTVTKRTMWQEVILDRIYVTKKGENDKLVLSSCVCLMALWLNSETVVLTTAKIACKLWSQFMQWCSRKFWIAGTLLLTFSYPPLFPIVPPLPAFPLHSRLHFYRPFRLLPSLFFPPSWGYKSCKIKCTQKVQVISRRPNRQGCGLAWFAGTLQCLNRAADWLRLTLLKYCNSWLQNELYCAIHQVV